MDGARRRFEGFLGGFRDLQGNDGKGNEMLLQGFV